MHLKLLLGFEICYYYNNSHAKSYFANFFLLLKDGYKVTYTWMLYSTLDILVYYIGHLDILGYYIGHLEWFRSS